MSQQFLDMLRGKLHFDSKQLSFCTHYSWFGVVKRERLGVEEVHLFYNRKPALLSPNFLTFRLERPRGTSERQRRRRDLPLRIEETDGRGFSGIIDFTATDILCYHARLAKSSRPAGVRARLLLPATEPRLTRRAAFDPRKHLLTVHARTPATDQRDPDPDHALTICMVVPEAFSAAGIIADEREVSAVEEDFSVETDGALVIEFAAASDDLVKEEQTFVVGIGEGPTADKIAERMPRVGHVSSDSATAASLDWLEKGLEEFTFDGVPAKLREHYAKSAYQILSNTKAPRGQIGRNAVFPSRGTYCAHYLWDACFTTLGAAHFNERLAEDFLLALCENQEKDGKIPQFVCATWNRPGESQPPLIAWSAWRLYKRFGNKELIRDIYEPLCRMVDWWFANRDEDGDGLAEYQHALESGWDDSPRFDKGRIAAVDLNAYLNREMRILAKMAPVLARAMEVGTWEERACDHAARMYDRLFDPEDMVFYDRLVRADRLHKVLTPASFTPLWAEVKMPREVALEMIARHLTNHREFFGIPPFPVVAYNEPTYDPDKWWRGPVWPNIAWAMTEVLRIYGFERWHKEAVKRLLEMMTASDEPNELYSSATGEPLGAAGLCWGCAVFMELARAFERRSR